MMRLTYDPEADAVYVYLAEADYAYGQDLDEARRVDYGPDGQPIGVELLNVSSGVHLNGVPCGRTIAGLLLRELKEHDVSAQVYA